MSEVAESPTKDAVHVAILVVGLVGLFACLYVGRPAEAYLKPILAVWIINAAIYAWRSRP